MDLPVASVNQIIKEYSAEFNTNLADTSIILAAGHGKRIKSNTSKMLHKIWEETTVNRVCEACARGLENSNTIVVVGIKAEEVVKSIGKRNSVSFANQEVQHGTGHAVQIALQNIPENYEGTVYIFPGDMGLIDAETIKYFKTQFENSKADMMVLTGIFEGPIEDNYYGRIVRVKDKDASGAKSKFKDKVIEIIEYKDILHLDKKRAYVTNYKRKKFKFTRTELIENREFNSGVYAFKFKPLAELIKKIESNNVQKEVYLTDLIGLFNNHGYSVEAVSPAQEYVLMGFNNKSVLKEMNSIARKLVYEKLKDIVLIDDPNDFFIADDLVEDFIKRDGNGELLDVEVSKGVYIGKGVKLGKSIQFGRSVRVEGKVDIGSNVFVDMNCQIIGTENQPCEIGSDVKIRGNCYISGSKVGNSSTVESSVLVNKIIAQNAEVKYIFPESVGENYISEK